ERPAGWEGRMRSAAGVLDYPLRAAQATVPDTLASPGSPPHLSVAHPRMCREVIPLGRKKCSSSHAMPHKVFLSRLKLTDFRNYAALSLPLDGRHVVLTGQNGAGKTNLMEAVSFLSPGRGLRRAAYGDVPRAGSEAGFSVFATLEGMQGEVDIGTGTEGGEDGQSRKLRLNGTPARTVDELLDHLRVVWLTPSMDGLFTGPSADRRRFLD